MTLEKLLEDALDYAKLCREIKAFTGGEQDDPFKSAAEYLRSNGVVPVVRCKDCKYSYCNKYCTNEAWKDEGNTVRVEPDDFCSYGERRTCNETG